MPDIHIFGGFFGTNMYMYVHVRMPHSHASPGANEVVE